MMLKVKDIFLLSLIILSCCATKHHEQKKPLLADSEIKVDSTIDQVVLVNARDLNRCQMGDLIRSISKCGPKIIGLSFLFVEEKDRECDSVLRSSIIESDKVVLMEGFRDDQMVESHRKFTSVALLTGPNTLFENEDGVTADYYRMIDYRGKWRISYPFLLALRLNESRAAELASKLTPVEYPITFYHKKEEFTVLNPETDFAKNRNLLKDKIVLVGYLGPTDTDLYNTPLTIKSDEKTYGTVIMANIILDILKDLK